MVSIAALRNKRSTKRYRKHAVYLRGIMNNYRTLQDWNKLNAAFTSNEISSVAKINGDQTKTIPRTVQRGRFPVKKHLREREREQFKKLKCN